MADYYNNFDEVVKQTKALIHTKYTINDETLTEIIRYTLWTSMKIDDETGYKRINLKYQKYPNWCCQKCGEEIGYLGRFMDWSKLSTLLMIKHKCEE